MTGKWAHVSKLRGSLGLLLAPKMNHCLRGHAHSRCLLAPSQAAAPFLFVFLSLKATHHPMGPPCSFLEIMKQFKAQR